MNGNIAWEETGMSNREAGEVTESEKRISFR